MKIAAKAAPTAATRVGAAVQPRLFAAYLLPSDRNTVFSAADGCATVAVMPSRGDPHARLLRKGRFSESDRVYIVTAATHRRAPIFFDLSLGRLVVHAFRAETERQRALTLAFVVMPDHFHWLFQLGSTAPLHRVVQAVKGYSAWSVNRARGRSHGKVWQRGFHDHAVRRDEDLLAIARYIITNPIRAGIVEDVGQYSLWDAVWL